MLVTNLDQMETIVDSQKDLFWEGWDVVRYTKSAKSIYSSDGAFRNGEWYKKSVFPITEQGWKLPNNVWRKYEQMER